MTDSNSTKVCRDCHTPLPLNQFHKNAECRDGRRPECRQCVKKYRQNYYIKHQNRLLSYSSEFYKVNRDTVLKQAKRYAVQNRNLIAKRSKRWREANHEKLLVDKQAYYHRNHKQITERKQDYAKQHPEQGKAATQRRRARKREAAGRFTASQWLAKCEYFGWRCYICGVTLSSLSAQPDHRKAISRGGSNWIANIAPACGRCNSSKGNKTESEYYTYIIFQKFPT